MDLSLYGFEGLTRLFNVHPAFVHFPVALLPAALCFYGLGVALKKPMLLGAGRGCMYLALLSVIVAVVTGLRAKESFPHNESIHHMIETHQTTGYIVLGLTALLVAWSFWHEAQRPKAAWAFVLVTAAASYFALQNGDIGSRMVYLGGAAVKPAVPVITEGQQHTHAHEDEQHAGTSGAAHQESGEHGESHPE